MITIEDYQLRRQTLIGKLKPNSVLVLASAKHQVRSRDTDYPFCQNKDFFYLTGFNEQNSVLVLSNRINHPSSTLFCEPKDEFLEIWHGRRTGPERAAVDYGFEQTYSINDVTEQLAVMLNGASRVYFAQGEQPDLDEQIFSVCKTLRQAPKQSKSAPSVFEDSRFLIHEMRLFKSKNEIAVMKKAAAMTIDAHLRAMKFCTPGCYEYQLQAELEHEFMMQGASGPAYGSIVGGGENACILHYTENSDQVQSGDLVLIDAGAEYQGYASDITRTFPANGRFTTEQALLYQLVLDAQVASIAQMKPGVDFKVASDTAIKVLTKGLIDLGLLEGDLQENIQNGHYRQFYMHGLGHWLGLDVHDEGNYKVNGQDRPLEPGMVITVEPGLYISSDANVSDRWKGIGIRIEDDVLITSDGVEVLTDGLPKTIQAIEALMASASL